MNQVAIMLTAGFVMAFWSGEVSACSIVQDDRPIEHIEAERIAMRNASKAAVVAPDCSFKDAGIYDQLRGAAAEDLGRGRVMQRIGEDATQALVVDCNTVEATLLLGPPSASPDSGECDWSGTNFDVSGPKAVASLAAGSDLHELERIFKAVGALTLDPIQVLNKDPWGQSVPARDRIDLTCGCKVFYPTSRGGKH